MIVALFRLEQLRNAMESESDVKIELRTEADVEVYVEVPWAVPYGRDNCYKLLNLPFYAYGISWGDIVETRPCAETGRPIFVRVVEKSGHQLVRVIFDPPVDESDDNQAHLDELVDLGCSYDGANPAYICIDIPPGILLSEITNYLTEHELEWEHADPKYSDLYPDG